MTPKKPNLPQGADYYLSNGPNSTVFLWRGLTYRFAQGRRGGTIYRAHPCVAGIIYRAAMRRRTRRERKTS